MLLKKLKQTPQIAKVYIFFGAFFIVLPSILGLYEGHTGKFLVSTGYMRGSTFHESVIYLQRHDFWGAYGVIINKPVQSREFRNPFPELSWNADLYDGGPVGYGTENLLLLEGQDNEPNKISLVNVISLRKDRPEIAEFLDNKKNIEPYKLFIGYSGWGTLQLNREIARGAWGIIDYDPALMLDTPSEKVWSKAIERVLEDRPAASGGV